MNWHNYAPFIMQSSDREFRVYKTGVKDTQAAIYVLKQLHEGAWVERGKFQTFADAQKAALDFSDA